ncbi:HEL120Wp [Eremothecium sinecaudum]|uniref:Phosphatidylinositol N-acetylglucosaminyltransferase GPI3 subunit n=1 Tax=Eremothecium sinecaudum TaxID=45286 RepID=A0A0X8HTF4_9SACH|nr:HEL120Wp [Eremothecium sinecaudum]AMD21160.1 HEL120Wp [Eremothecium sinecaudum]
MTRINVAMVCDFFYPQLGGVEFHIYHLSQKLIELGHSVVIITHAYGDRKGVRYLTNGLKVYYVPYLVLYRETTFPTVFASFPIIRNILLREQIHIVHSHVSVSTLAHESILHANTLGIYTVFTDHSLYGFDSIGSILVNKLLKFTLTCVDHTICVSHTCKENMVLRADLEPDQISVIPNAVVSKDFKPRSNNVFRTKDCITIVVISRLFPNKGADLLTHLIPRVCALHKRVEFIIAGDGPNFVDFQQMIESFRLQERVQLLGAVNHEDVRDVMCLGDIYLHASLTEAFGTVLVEAASCGLLIVTTKVGGIPEVLPEHMTVYASETSVSSLVEATSTAIQLLNSFEVDTSSFHSDIRQMYDWLDVARRTVEVYKTVRSQPTNKNWIAMLEKFYKRDNVWARTLFVLCCVTEYILWYILEWWAPRSEIDIVPKWPAKSSIHS